MCVQKIVYSLSDYCQYCFGCADLLDAVAVARYHYPMFTEWTDGQVMDTIIHAYHTYRRGITHGNNYARFTY